jgi:hypothetical protein
MRKWKLVEDGVPLQYTLMGLLEDGVLYMLKGLLEIRWPCLYMLVGAFRWSPLLADGSVRTSYPLPAARRCGSAGAPYLLMEGVGGLVLPTY